MLDLDSKNASTSLLDSDLFCNILEFIGVRLEKYSDYPTRVYSRNLGYGCDFSEKGQGNVEKGQVTACNNHTQ